MREETIRRLAPGDSISLSCELTDKDKHGSGYRDLHYRVSIHRKGERYYEDAEQFPADPKEFLDNDALRFQAAFTGEFARKIKERVVPRHLVDYLSVGDNYLTIRIDILEPCFFVIPDLDGRFYLQKEEICLGIPWI